MGCQGLFADIDDLSESDLNMIEAGSCLDPENVIFQGTETFKDIFQRTDVILSY